MPYDIDPRLLRAFLAVAEELHFTRAAARLYVAQQALSRDIRRLERELGAALFVRTTRQVALTAEGEAAAARPAGVGGPRRAGRRVPRRPRATAAGRCGGPDRHRPRGPGGGQGPSAGQLRAGRPLPQRADGGGGKGGGRTARCLLRPDRGAAARGTGRPRPSTGQAGADGGPAARGPSAGRAARRRPRGAGRRDALRGRRKPADRGVDGSGRAALRRARHRHRRAVPGDRGQAGVHTGGAQAGWSVLASVEFIEVPGMVLRPLVDPVPLSPVSLVWRRGLRHPGLDALRAAARELARRHAWLALPDSAWWLPEADAEAMGVRG